MDEFFNYFLDNFIINKIVFYTNKRLKSGVRKTTANEIKGFFGCMLLMGLLRKGHVEIKDIYNAQSAQHVDWVSICMSRDRFKLLC